MPLSDHEQRLLEQIERALYAEDPEVRLGGQLDRPAHARAPTGPPRDLPVGARHGRLLAGVMTTEVALGVAGFCLMLFALVYAASQYKKVSGRPDLRVAGSDRPAPRRGKQRKMPLLQRMEERFRRRFDDR